MNKYLPIFNEIFSSITDEYKFKINCISDEMIVLFKADFELEFLMWREATDLSYNIIISETKVEKIRITDFIVSNMIQKDRNIAEKIGSNDSAYERNIRALKYFSNVLSRSFSGMLAGDRKWLEDYKKSPYFVEPRIIAR